MDYSELSIVYSLYHVGLQWVIHINPSNPLITFFVVWGEVPNTMLILSYLESTILPLGYGFPSSLDKSYPTFANLPHSKVWKRDYKSL